MKRLLSILLATVMMFTLTVPAAFAAGGAAVSVTSASAKSGETVKIAISLVGLTEPVTNAELKVSADPALTLIDLEPANLPGIVVANPASGKVIFSHTDPVSVSSLAVATFRVADDASGDYTVTATVSGMRNGDGVKVYATPGTGKVSVHKCAPVGGWYYSTQYHWQVCECHKTLNKGEHVPGPAATYESAQVCTICGYEIAPKLPIPHEHVWGAWTAYSAVLHTRVCASDSTHVDYAEHTFVDNICSDCGYELEIVVPDDPDIPDGDGLSAQELMLLMMLLRTHTSTVTATAGEGGVITPSGETKVSFGKDQTYRIIPQPGYMIESVVVDGKDKGAISEYTFKRVLTKHTITATFKRIPWVNPFSDVKEGDWFYNYVACANSLGLMIGTSDTAFSPEAATTRAQIVTTLWRLENEPNAESKADFTDVADGMWYTAAIHWAAENGIVEGHGDGTFGPDDEITREQIFAILHRYAAYKEWAAEAEAEISAEYICSDWAKENIAWAHENGLLFGIGVDIKDMTATASRAEIAAYLSWFCLNVIAK